MTLPKSEPIYEEEPVHRTQYPHRKRRRWVPGYTDERRIQFVEGLASRVAPTYDFFLFSLLAGIVFGAGFIVDSPALLVFAALIAPFMAPVVGLSLASVLGSVQFFLVSLAGTVVGSVIVFAGGFISGLAAQAWPYPVFKLVSYHSTYNWGSFGVLTLSVIIAVLSLMRKEEKPVLPSVAIAYVLYSTAAASGFGFGSGVEGIWPQSAGVFAGYLIWAVVLGAIVFAVFGFRPRTVPGYLASIALAVVVIACVVYSTNLWNKMKLPALPFGSPAQMEGTVTPRAMTALPAGQGTPGPQSGQTPVPAVLSTNNTPLYSGTPTPLLKVDITETSVPTWTLTPSITPTATPVWGTIYAKGHTGARIREKADINSKTIAILDNGIRVKILPDTTVAGGNTWIKVQTIDGKIGWIVQDLLQTATPVPNW
jgi:uncharacterized membrane protein